MAKSPGMMLAIGLGKPRKGAPEPPASSSEPVADDESSGTEFKSFATAAFDALKSDDVEAFSTALKGALMCCQDEGTE